MAVRYSVDLCGITGIALTLLDVLSGLKEVKVCTGYQIAGKPLDYFRADMDTLAEVEPVYETLPGWEQDVSRVRKWADLPAAAKPLRGTPRATRRRPDPHGERRTGAHGDADPVSVPSAGGTR